MMQFRLDETQEMIRHSIAAFCADMVTEHALMWNDENDQPVPEFQSLADLGMHGILVPEAADGAGLGMREAVVALEEIAASDAGLAAMLSAHAIQAAGALLTCGAPPKLLKDIADGRTLYCFATTAAAGRLDGPGTTGTIDAGGRVRASLACAAGGRVADAALLIVSGDGGPEVAVVGLEGAGCRKTARKDLLGLRTAGCADIMLDRVPAKARFRLQAEQAAHIDAIARIAAAAIGVGLARASLEAGTRYSLQREQFGRPISRLQPIQWQTADSAVDLETARLLTWRAAALLDTAAHAPAFRAAAQAHAAAIDAARRVSDRALQIHGGYGYTSDFPVERFYRDAWCLHLLAGGGDRSRDEIARALARAAVA